MSCSVLLSILRQIGERFVHLLSPSPNLQSWEQEPSGSVIRVAGTGLSRARFGECICLTEGSQKAQLWRGWRERFVLGMPASLWGLWMDPRVELQHVGQD